jgi:gas vesicle protein
MSRKTKKQHHEHIENENMQQSKGMDVTSTARERLDTVVDTVNSNKVLIGAIAGACGAAVFLMTTESGKRVRNEIQDRVLDLYDYVSDQMVDGLDRIRGLVSDMVSQKSDELEQVSNKIKRVA